LGAEEEVQLELVWPFEPVVQKELPVVPDSGSDLDSIEFD
jgi:hypothetical protein